MVAIAAFYLAAVDAYSYSEPPALRAVAQWFTGTSWRGIGWSVLGYTTLTTIVNIRGFLKASMAESAAKKMARRAMNEMQITYDELRTEGPVSASRVRELATKG